MQIVLVIGSFISLAFRQQIHNCVSIKKPHLFDHFILCLILFLKQIKIATPSEITTCFEKH
jgi:hypothetical protein